MNIQSYLEVVIPVLAVVAPVVRQYLVSKRPELYAHIREVAKTAVAAADKLGTDAGADGPAKLNYASEIVVAGAKKFGIKLTPDEVLAFVHAALRELSTV